MGKPTIYTRKIYSQKETTNMRQVKFTFVNKNRSFAARNSDVMWTPLLVEKSVTLIEKGLFKTSCETLNHSPVGYLPVLVDTLGNVVKWAPEGMFTPVKDGDKYSETAYEDALAYCQALNKSEVLNFDEA